MRRFVKICWDAFSVFAGMAWDCSTYVEMHFVSSQAWEGFDHHMLRCNLCLRCHVMCHVVNTCWDTLWVLTGMVCVWSTHVEMHYLFSLSWVGFGQHMLWYILCPHWYGVSLVNASWDAFLFALAWVGFGNLMLSSVLIVMVWIRLTQVEIHFVASLTWEGFSHPMSICIFRPRWHGRRLVNTLWVKFWVLADIEDFCSTQVDKHFVSFQWWYGFGQLKLRYILCSSFSLDLFGQHKFRYN